MAQADRDDARWLLSKVNRILFAHDAIRAQWEADAQHEREAEQRA